MNNKLLTLACAGLALPVAGFGAKSAAPAGAAGAKDGSTSGAAAKKLPNIVFILADDMGYGDVSYLNADGKIPTPNIDRIARAGVVFTGAHSGSAVSTPTRYGILTGRYAWRTRLKRWVLGHYEKPLIPPTRTTMASMLRSQGYTTGAVGKWHLGWDFPTTDGQLPRDKENDYNLDFTKPIPGGPTAVGFDWFFGVDVPNYPPFCFIENDRTIGVPSVWYPTTKRPEETSPGVPKVQSDAGHGIPGWTFEPILPTLGEKAAGFITSSAKSEKPFFLYFALTAPHNPISPTEQFLGKSGLNRYADFIMELDGIVGKVLDALQKAGVADNTIVVFTSDNGVTTQSDIPFLVAHGHLSSYVFRSHKGSIYDGGHHIPCLMEWPAKLKHTTIPETICLNDFITTFADLTGYKFSDNDAEDSFSLMPLLFPAKGQSYTRKSVVHHSVDGSFSIREGKWKLILTPKDGLQDNNLPDLSKFQPDDVFQLYDMDNDIGETTNLVTKYPDLVRQFKQELMDCIDNGRSTPGPKLSNDAPWPDRYMQWRAFD